MNEETELKPCPCGKVPDYISIEAAHDEPKWAMAGCSHCGEWLVEFRNNHADLQSDECRKAADAAWNNAPRALSPPPRPNTFRAREGLFTLGMTMRFLSLFSGIEAASEAWTPLGWICVAVAEIEPFPCAALAHHHPDVPNLGDVTKITAEDIKALGPIDLVVFGSPCQDLSLAGKRAGFKGERSGLFHTAVRIVRWAREHGGCRFALWENVPGAFSSNAGRDFAVVVAELAGLEDVEPPAAGWGTEGAAVGDHGLLEWSTLDAQWFNLAQRRERVFALADFGDWTDRPPILLEPESLRGDSAPRREAGEGAAGDAGEGFAATGAGCWRGGLGPLRAESGSAIYDQVVTVTGDIAHALNTANNGKGCSEDGTGRGVPTIALSVALRGREGGGVAELGDEVGNCLRASGGGGDKPRVLAFPANLSGTQSAATEDLAPAMGAKNPTTIAFDWKMGEKARSVAYSEDLAPTLGAQADRYAVSSSLSVRRLTPRECERLQGHPDDNTRIPLRKYRQPQITKLRPADRWELIDGEWWLMAADGNRYKAIGNSMAVNVMSWIGRKINEASAA